MAFNISVGRLAWGRDAASALRLVTVPTRRRIARLLLAIPVIAVPGHLPRSSTTRSAEAENPKRSQS